MAWLNKGQLKDCGWLDCTSASLDSVTTLPNHGADGTAQHVGDETLEEGLFGEILIVLL